MSGSLEEDPDQVDPASLATREALDVLEQEVLAEAEAVGQPGHDGLGLVAAVLPELLLEVGEELDVLGCSGSLAIWVRALSRASSSTSRPRPERTWEKPLGSRPSPWGTGTWGRTP